MDPFDPRDPTGPGGPGAGAEPGGSGADAAMDDLVRRLAQDGEADAAPDTGFRILRPDARGRVDADPEDLGPEVMIAAEATRMIEPIALNLVLLAPPEWEWLRAEFAYTVSAEISLLRFRSAGRSADVPVPAHLAALVRDQRDVTASLSAGPWWRLVLTITHDGETTVTYDYADAPFPEDQLHAPEHYRADLDAYPARPPLPTWLAHYVTTTD